MATTVIQKIRNPKYLNENGDDYIKNEYNFPLFLDDMNEPKEDAWITLNEYCYEDVYNDLGEKIKNDGDLFIYGKLKDENAVDTKNIKTGSITKDKLAYDVQDIIGGMLIGPKDETNTNSVQPEIKKYDDESTSEYNIRKQNILKYTKLWIETESI